MSARIIGPAGEDLAADVEERHGTGPSDTNAPPVISVNEDVEGLALPGADPGASAPPEGRT